MVRMKKDGVEAGEGVGVVIREAARDRQRKNAMEIKFISVRPLMRE
tara:strand:- start:886 stop:1023 length:138 start_codon:yes stop_codon:yes gene_type:complete